MARSRISYILFFMACVVFSVAYRSRISAVLMTAVAIYPILAAILTGISVYFLKAGFGEARGVYEKNEQFELPVYIVNNFILPYAPAEFECLLPDNDTGLFLKKQVYASVSPLKRMRIFLPCMHRYRGSYSARILKLTVYDPLKLIRISRRMDESMQLVILPRKLPLEELGGIFGGERGAVSERSDSGEKEDFSHVREYVSGDVLQQLHWKLTAKQQELMIKQYASDSSRHAALLLDFSCDSAVPSTVLRSTDMVIEAAVAVAMSALESGIKVIADAGISEGACRISDKAGFDRFYDLMSVILPKPEAADFLELCSRYAAMGHAGLFIITPAVSGELFELAEYAAKGSSGAVVLLHICVSGKPQLSPPENRSFIYAAVSGDTERALPEAAEQIIAEAAELHYN